jgi:hypothetical protein
MVGTFKMPGGLSATTLSDPPLWENSPPGPVATPLTVVALLMTPIGEVIATTFVTAFPDVVASVAPVKNDPCVAVVCTLVRALANVGFTAVTAAPVCPVTLFTTLPKVAVTSVTHVAAEAEDNSAAFRLATLTASRRKRQVMPPSYQSLAILGATGTRASREHLIPHRGHCRLAGGPDNTNQCGTQSFCYDLLPCGHEWR